MISKSNEQYGDDENALVIHAIAGDSEAFGVLYKRYMDAIYRYVYFRVSNAQEAEDLTEEVFVKAWEAMPKFKLTEYPFTSWLYRIAHNLTIDYHRKRRPLPLVDEPESKVYFDLGPDASTEEQVAFQEEVDTLVEAVQKLEEKEQLIVVLRFVEGLSHREVGKIIGKSEQHSRVLQHRVLAKLQEHLSS